MQAIFETHDFHVVLLLFLKIQELVRPHKGLGLHPSQ